MTLVLTTKGQFGLDSRMFDLRSDDVSSLVIPVYQTYHVGLDCRCDLSELA